MLVHYVFPPMVFVITYSLEEPSPNIISTISEISLVSSTLYRLVPAWSEGRANTFGDFPRDSWGTVLPRALLIWSCGFFTLFAHA